jgi:hypothetical protein
VRRATPSLVGSDADSDEKDKNDGGDDGAADSGVEYDQMYGDCACHGSPRERCSDLRAAWNQQQNTSDALDRACQVAKPVAETDVREELDPDRSALKLGEADGNKQQTSRDAEHPAVHIDRLLLWRRLGKQRQPILEFWIVDG